jgi:hypothetical protein
MHPLFAALLFASALHAQTYTGAGTGGVQRTVSAGILDWIKGSDYGMVCDGSTDDSAALQAVLNYSASMAGKNRTVLLPAVTCKANVTITTNQSLIGAGWATTNPGFSGPAGATTLVDASSGTKAVITVSSMAGDYVTIQNVTLKGSGSGAADRGIYAASSSYLDVDNVSCFHFGEECLRWETGVGLRGVHLFAAQALLNRARTAHSGALYIAGTDAFISDSEVGASLQIEGHSISGNCYNDAIVVLGADNQLVNVHGETSELGLYMAGGGRSRISNGIFDLNYCSGGWIAAGGNMLNNVLFLRNGRDGNGTWDGMQVSAVNGQFDNITFDQTNSAPTLTFGITDTGSSGNANYNSYSNIRSYSISGPMWNVSTTGPEIFYGYKDAVTIADGTISPNLTGFQNFSFLQSTTLLITSFSGGTPGQSVCFLGNAHVTFGTGGNIKPPNATAQPLQAGMVYCYRNMGNNWYWINTDNNPQFASVTASGSVTGLNVVAGHLHGVSNTPSISAGAGAGTGASVSITGSDVAGWFSVTAGTNPAAFSQVMRIAFARTYLSQGAICSLTPFNTSAVGTPMIFKESGSGTIDLTVTTPALNNGTTYQWSYICVQGQGL